MRGMFRSLLAGLAAGAALGMALTIMAESAADHASAGALSGMAQLLGRGFPMTYFLPVSVGTFTKGLGYSDLWFNALVLALFAAGFLIAAHTFLRKQET